MQCLISELPAGYSLRLILVRHGEPDQSAKGRCYGSLDVGLSERGRAQIETKLNLVRSLGAEALYASPLRRASESAAIAGPCLGLKPIFSPDLQEINFGSFEGLRYEEIERTYPEEYRSWMEHPAEVRFPQGESFAEMKTRVLKFKEFVRSVHSRQTVVAISHGGTNRIILAEAMRIPDEFVFRIDQAYAAINIIDYFDREPVVRLING